MRRCIAAGYAASSSRALLSGCAMLAQTPFQLDCPCNPPRSTLFHASTPRRSISRAREGGKEEGEGRMVAQFREVTRFCHVITSVVKEALRGASKRARISRARFRTRGIRATVPPVIPWLKSNFNVTAGNLANTAANFLARANHLRVDSLEREREEVLLDFPLP